MHWTFIPYWITIFTSLLKLIILTIIINYFENERIMNPNPVKYSHKNFFILNIVVFRPY